MWALLSNWRPVFRERKYSHLRRIISDTSCVADENIMNRCFIRQTNYMRWFFMSRMCQSSYPYFCLIAAVILWLRAEAILSDNFEFFGTTWRKGLGRVLNLPVNTYSVLSFFSWQTVNQFFNLVAEHKLFNDIRFLHNAFCS